MADAAQFEKLDEVLLDVNRQIKGKVGVKYQVALPRAFYDDARIPGTLEDGKPLVPETQSSLDPAMVADIHKLRISKAYQESLGQYLATKGGEHLEILESLEDAIDIPEDHRVHEKTLMALGASLRDEANKPTDTGCKSKS